jgi:predicted DNA-binding transcriptional regulator AlpA
MQPERKVRRLLGIRAVEEMVGLRRTALAAAIERGDVPRPVKTGDGKQTRRWFEDEIIAYQEARAAARDNPLPKKTKHRR